MAQSTEWTAMKQALKATVIPRLRAAGFRGSFPHLRRIRGEKTELISFLAHSQYGGAFEVGASVLFLHAETPEDTNLFHPDMQTMPEKLTWGHGRIRNGLPGLYHGAFYYVDTYRKELYLPDLPGTHYHYTALTPAYEKHLLEHLKANHYELVMKADAGIYERMAALALNQLDALLAWFDRMNTMDDLRRWAAQENRRKKC